MAENNCPVCYSKLVVKQLTPCMDCGGEDFEMDHYQQHDYNEYEIYSGQRLVLCNFCDVDFGSYHGSYFGFKGNKRLGFEHFNLVKKISDKNLRTGKYCTECGHPLAFLKFVAFCRKENSDKSE